MIFQPNYTFELQSEPKYKQTKLIKVIGIGGAGGNAVAYMSNLGIHNVDLVVCNTDEQVLNTSTIPTKIQLGIKTTKGLGAGTRPEVGREAAIESEAEINQLFTPTTEMVFITAGMGGGTGTGAAPVIAKLAKDAGLLTIAIVTDPFDFEGEEKIEQARKGIQELYKCCDTVIVIKNSRLESMFGDMRITQAYAKADEVLANAVKSIAELITRPGIINLDFADVKMVLGQAGHAVIGSFEAEGSDRAKIAITEALSSPLLENNDIYGSERVLVTIAYSDEKEENIPTMRDQMAITKFVEDEIKKDKNNKAKVFKLGYAIDSNLGDKIRVTVIAAGFNISLENLVMKSSTLDYSIPIQPRPLVIDMLPIQKYAQSTGDIFMDKYLNGYKIEQTNESPESIFHEKSERIETQKMVDLFVKLNYQLHDLSRPSFMRNRVDLVDIKTIKSHSDVQVYSLTDLYSTLMTENIL